MSIMAIKNHLGSGFRIIGAVAIIGLLLGFVLTEVFAQEEAESNADAAEVVVDGMKQAPISVGEFTPENPYIIEPLNVDGRVDGDFVVGPGKVELEIRPGTTKTIMMTVSNRIGETQDFFLTTEDATANSDPSVTVQLLGGQRGPYTLKDYLILPAQKITLEHGQRARFPVTISIPADAEPGGRYGSVLVKTVAVKANDGRADNIVPQSPIEARIGTLFFITIPGEADRAGKLLDISTIPDSKWFEQGPITFGIMFENTGSVHLAPYGRLSVTNILGDEVGFVELDPWFALPKSQRFREAVWNNTNLIGRYTATLELNRGYQDIIDTKTVTFWVLPWKIVAGSFAGLFIVLFLIRTFFKNFEFKRKV